MASDAWTSTKALSVYNVILKAKQPLPLDIIRSWLSENFREDIGNEYVSMGAGYLLARGFVVEAGNKLAPTQPGRPLVRTKNDVDLDWA